MSESKEIVIVQNQLKKIIHKEGQGQCPTKGQQVFATYCGKLADGLQFDSCTDTASPFSFVIGQGQVIKGWDEGFATMKKGQKATLICSPQYAYGQRGSPPKIPPNATLHFDVQLIDFSSKQKQKWQLSQEEKIQSATTKKNAGNQALKKGQFNEAIKQYKSGIQFVDMEESADAKNLLKVLKLNISQAYLKTKQYSECIKFCTEVLKQQPQNAKALYRRGVAHSKNQDFQESKTDFQQLLKVDPNNSDAKNELHNNTLAKRQYDKQQKKVYASMFSTSLYDDKKIQPPKPKEQQAQQNEDIQPMQDQEQPQQKA